MDRITDLELKNNKLKGGLNTDGPPDISFLIRCLNESHGVRKELDKGVFLISGKELNALNPRQMIEWADTKDMTGCSLTG